MNEELINFQMVTLGLTREQAIDLIKNDLEIEKGKKMFELTKEQQTESKKARIVDRKPGGNNKKSNNVNEQKKFLIEEIAAALNEGGAADINVTNDEREIIFNFENVKYKIVLSAPRS